VTKIRKLMPSPNVSKHRTYKTYGTGKGSPIMTTHRATGAVNAPKGARTPLDNRGTSNKRGKR
jgi:hypothetical protein